MSGDPQHAAKPTIAWHLPSAFAEVRWTISVLLLPQVAALLAIAFFSRGLCFTSVPVISVNASVLHHYRGIWAQQKGPSYTLEGGFVAQTSSGPERSARFTTSDFMMPSGFLFRGFLDREAAALNARTVAYESGQFGEILLVQMMHPSAMPVVLVVFGLTAAACESWTRIFYCGEPLSRRARSTLRTSTTPLLSSWAAMGITGAVVLVFLPMFVDIIFPLWILLPAFVVADFGSIVLWSRGRLPLWATDGEG